jgi:hypothetical protein
MRAIPIVVILAAAACGHKPPPPTDTPDNGGGGGDGEAPPPPPDNSASMVPPDKQDEIRRAFERKRETVSRCLAIAVDNKELPRNSKGRITLEIVITAGQASSIKVVKASLDSQTLHDCVIKKVKEIAFPSLNQAYETSFTYEFEAI